MHIKRIHDISMEIHEGMLIYPGNPAPKIRLYSKIPRHTTNESKITMGSHTGTHVDAGRHVSNGGYTADEIPLGSCIGKCRVLDLTGCGNEIHAVDIRGKLGKAGIILLKTNNSLKQYNHFRKNFAHVSKDAAEYLVRSGVRTLGVDYLSAKAFGRDGDVHALLINRMTLFEGLHLRGINEGDYTFIGLPLRIATDGSPARAVLLEGVIR